MLRWSILVLMAAGLGAAETAAPAGPAMTLFGRLHMLALHFPIALLIVAMAIDVLRRRKRRPTPSDSTFVMVALGAASAVVASAMGLVHADVEGMHNALIERHERFGLIATALALVASGLCWWARRPSAASSGACDWSFRVVLAACVVVLGIGAHSGGESVHGEGYLTADLQPRTPDTAAVATVVATPAIATVDFTAQVLPLLERACIECHGTKKQKGKLRLDSRDAALAGGDGGAAIIPGDGANSLMVLRSNPPGVPDEDLMPLKKEPLTPAEVALLIRWIDEGASYGADAGGAP